MFSGHIIAAHAIARRCLGFVLLVGLGAVAPLDTTALAEHPESPVKTPGARRIWSILNRNMDVTPFSKQMPLKEALGIFHERLGCESLGISIFVDMDAFKYENPDLIEDIYETPVRLPKYPRTLTAAAVLDHILHLIPTNNAAFLVKPGVIHITTRERTSVYEQLMQPVHLNCRQVPLYLLLQDIHDRTGVSVFLDPRVGNRGRTPVTIYFTQDVSLSTSLYLAAEVCNLKLVLVNNVVVITRPDIAQQILRDTMLYPYGFLNTPYRNTHFPRQQRIELISTK